MKEAFKTIIQRCRAAHALHQAEILYQPPAGTAGAEPTAGIVNVTVYDDGMVSVMVHKASWAKRLATLLITRGVAFEILPVENLEEGYVVRSSTLQPPNPHWEEGNAFSLAYKVASHLDYHTTRRNLGMEPNDAG